MIEQGNCAETFASLRLFGDELNPLHVSDVLGVEATDSAAKGAVTVSPSGKERRAPTGRWILTSEGQIRSRNLQDHIAWLLDQVNTLDRVLGELPGVTSADVFCYWASATGNGGPKLAPAILARLAAIGLTLGFDLYFHSEEPS